MSEDQENEGKRKLKLVAGVFVDPESGMLETHAGEDGIDPIVVMASAVMENMKMAVEMIKRLETMQGKPKILRASGPLPKDNRNGP